MVDEIPDFLVIVRVQIQRGHEVSVREFRVAHLLVDLACLLSSFFRVLLLLTVKEIDQRFVVRIFAF